MSTPPVVNHDARLSELVPGAITAGAPWYITHGLGGPAAGTYTEIAFTEAALGVVKDATPAAAERVLNEVVRQVAASLYGTAWSNLYRPEQHRDCIARYEMRRRERVVVTAVEVWDW